MACSTPGFPVYHQLPEFTQERRTPASHLTKVLLPDQQNAMGAQGRKQLHFWRAHKFFKEEVTWVTFELGSAQFSRSVISNSLRPHGLQHARLPCPSPFPRPCSNSCPLSQWCHPTISSSVVPFSLLLLPSIFPSIRVFPNELALCIM